MVGLLRSCDTVVGLVPLHIAYEKVTPIGPVLRSVRFLGDGSLCPDHLVLPVAAGYEGALARLLVEELRRREAGWDRVELRDLLEDHPAWKHVEAAAQAAGYLPSWRHRTRCPFMRLPESWDAYLAGMDKEDRKQVNYRFRRVERQLGEVCVREPQSIGEVDAFMDRLEDLHAQSWNRRGRAGVFVEPAFRRFHRIHSRRAFRARRLMLIALWAGTTELATALGFHRHDAAEGYQFGYDPSLRAYGPGALMVMSAIRHAIENGLKEMDMLRGSGEYKYRLTHAERRGVDLVIGRGTLSDHSAALSRWARLRIGGAFRFALNRDKIERVKRILHIRS
jgi:CelD/BcsL family acetyltransferase involved in cellulose biosynthesis